MEHEKKLKGHRSNTKLQQLYEFKLWLFICYESESNTHTSYSYSNHKIRPSWFSLDLDSLGLLKQNNLPVHVRRPHSKAVSWMWASIPLKGGSFAAEISSRVVIDLTEIPSCLHTFIQNHMNIYSFIRLIIHNHNPRKMLGWTTETSVTELRPSCQLKIVTI